MATQNRARYWTGILWTENLPSNWEDTIADTVQLPFAYCKHDKDKDTKQEQRKDHVHVILAWPSPTTYKNALAVFKSIGGAKACNSCQAINNMRYMYDYLIHDTDSCKKAGKHLYEPRERVCGNNFDIGTYEQVSQADKDAKFQELALAIRTEGFINFAEFFDFFVTNYVDDSVAWEILRSHGSNLERLTRGNYQRHQQLREFELAVNERAKSYAKKAELDELIKESEEREQQMKAETCTETESEKPVNLERGDEKHSLFGNILPKRECRVPCDENQESACQSDLGVVDGMAIEQKKCPHDNARDTDRDTDRDTENLESAATRNDEDFERFFCPECGSVAVKKKGKTAAGTQRYQCKDCKQTFVAGEKPPTGKATKQAIEQAQAETRDKKEQQTKNLECAENKLNKENQPAGGLPVEPVGSFECRRE